MITGLVLIAIGLFIGFWGATRYNLFIMFGGWMTALVGVTIFITRIMGLP